MTFTMDARLLRALLLLAGATACVATGACGASAPDATADAQRVARAVSTATDRRVPHRDRIEFLQAEGTIDPGWILPPTALPPLPAGLEFRARCIYPDADGLLAVSVFVTGVGAPTMLPLPPASVVSQLQARVDRAWRSRQPEPNLLITGTVLSTPVPSPFGEQIGRLIAVTAGFTGTGSAASFSQLAMTVSGSHATTLPAATGAVGSERDD